MMSETRPFAGEMSTEFSREKIKSFLKRIFDNDPELAKYKKDNNPDLTIHPARSFGFIHKLEAGEDIIIDIISFDKDGVLTFNVFADEKEKEKGEKRITTVKMQGEILKEIK